jgi:hypothetical protein
MACAIDVGICHCEHIPQEVPDPLLSIGFPPELDRWTGRSRLHEFWQTVHQPQILNDYVE